MKSEDNSTTKVNPIGKRYGRWTVKEITKKQNKAKSLVTYWLCKCECGTIKEVHPSTLRRGLSTSCGCSRFDFKTDPTGQRYGRWTVVKLTRVYKGKYSRVRWICECDCGTLKEVDPSNLRCGKSVSCGCSLVKTDFTGQRIGNWTVIEMAKERKGNKVHWICKCACGTIREITSDRLKNEGTKSCGCLYDKRQNFEVYFKEAYKEGTNLANIASKKARSNTGIVGVSKLKNGKFNASICFRGKSYSRGTYETLEEAVEAREKAEIEMFAPILKKYEHVCYKKSQEKQADSNMFEQ
jgi:hypothetical protein